ncbi:MAG: homoserine dehydrogenase [Ruminococcaceae bacterium]|nr:homoserine dehydrogenase [Oscillospiraceae bacterium]
MAKVAVMGYGVVGSGVVEALDMNKVSIRNRVKEPVEVKYILDIREFKDDPFGHLITKDFDKIANDPEISVVAEVMGGLNPAYDFTKKLLMAGKSVVTSNKELVATYGAELLKIARENKVNYLFEASVGGGIPVIRPIYACLAANEINSVMGILNGTTNYILTKMYKDGVSFESALKEAQELGYAERNPAADVEGHDACRKIAILTSLVCGKNVDYNKINTVGITDIDELDVVYAEKMDSVIKLIGASEVFADKVYSSVEPCILNNSHPLAGIEDVFNGVLINGNAVDDVMFYGRGAGKLPTASAVVADIIDCVRNKDGFEKYSWEPSDSEFVAPYEENKASYLVRIQGEANSVQIEKIFGDLETVTVADSEFAVITPYISNKELDSVLKELPVIKKIKIIK